ncbi:calycin-like domain-containing protein [Bacteroides zhangwenhongii]|uniref:Calycin-like domain-containing protein n=1 Tax=Bacteroides zhangwenhongii TaxID=2650157 RepID=A0ABT5H7J4_9BACE|nr:calycin-like domain-containing protein [Bacteroides zhangwenhongii]MDC7136564.1 calycin-like domain-containing protein [Bacteroides zhangwenhongii]OKZ23448.1 MAG: hypothetical protein BHV74_06765 [Bacteroides finegoldii]
MKKNLLYLLALVCSITFFAACSSDDDDSKKNEGNEPEEEAVVTAPDVVGTYWGNLNISMIADGSDQENVIADGVPKFITFSQVSDTEIKIELKDFELFMNGKIMKFGDIVIDKCTVKKGEGISTFTGQQQLTFAGEAAALGACDVTVAGTVEGADANMTINVKVSALQQTVKVTYSGVKQVENPDKE